ncbi:unnamed protein product [Schistosoma turkestanicum]|nr:unnamed protein product [Schistosoma turkestanicum]
MVVTYNSRNPAVKRLMKEAQELSDPTELYFAKPLEDNLFEWHFTIRGPEDSDFQGGVYHGRILLPSEYPMKPPNIVLLTPNGRFEIHRKICLSISGYHPESWRPSWSIRTALLALIGFMPTHGVGAIGSLNQPKEERQLLARKSQSYVCSICGPIHNLLLPLTIASSSMNKEASEAAAQISMMSEEEVKNKKSLTKSNTPTTPTPTPTSSTTTTTTLQSNSFSTSSSSSSCNFTCTTPATAATTTTTSFPTMPSIPIIPTMLPMDENIHSSYTWPKFSASTSTSSSFGMYPCQNENKTSQIAYWLCFPVYYYYPMTPFPMTMNSASTPLVGSNLTASNNNCSGTSMNGERVPLSFSEWLKSVREKEKSDTTSVQQQQDTPSAASSSSSSTTATTNSQITTTTATTTTTTTTHVLQSSNESSSSSSNKSISSDQQHKNQPITEEISSSSCIDKPLDNNNNNIQNQDSIEKPTSQTTTTTTNLHEHSTASNTDDRLANNTLTKTDDNSNSSSSSSTEMNKNTTHKIQTDTTDELVVHNRTAVPAVGRSVNTSNRHAHVVSSQHTRQSTSLVQYHTATVCAVGVAIALFIVVIRRLAIILQDA